jgi:hypothetical protein
MSAKNFVITYEDLIKRSQEVISDFEFDVSSVIIPFSEFIKPLKKNYVSNSVETESYIKNILIQELR